MQKTKILYFITRMDQGGAQASVLLTLKNINKQQFETYLACGPGGRLDARLKNDPQHVFFISALRHDIRPKYFFAARITICFTIVDFPSCFFFAAAV